jgi:hypothetical protein
MNLKDLSIACPAVDFTVPFKPSDSSYSIGDHVLEYLQKTFEIIKSSPNIENSVIVEFVKAGFTDNQLPFSKASLIEDLELSESEAQDLHLAQSSFFAVSFEPGEFKNLGPFDSVPFSVDLCTSIRAGTYGMVQKVFEGDDPLAKKTISDDYYLEKLMMEIEIMKLATETGNPHLVHLRCAYKQENRACLVMYPWCEFDLKYFLNCADTMQWWTRPSAKEKLIILTNWMTCLASGLSALHKKNIMHQDMKPENIMLDANSLPVICEFGHSMTFKKYRKSVKVHGSLAYFSPEQLDGKAERKSDIFSLGLVFVEIALFFYGQKWLKQDFISGFFVDITNCLDEFLAKKFPIVNHLIMDGWNRRFQSLVRSMLDVAPENRPKASEVWEKAKEMVELLGAKPHCEDCEIEE